MPPPPTISSPKAVSRSLDLADNGAKGVVERCRLCRTPVGSVCDLVVPGARSGEGARIPLRRLKAGQDLLAQGEDSLDVYSVNSGWLFLYVLLADGRRQIVHFALPGALLGFAPMDGRVTYGIQALTDASVCVLPRSDLMRAVRDQPHLAMRLAWLLAHDELLAYDHLTSVGRMTARERVAHLLLELFLRSQHRFPGQRGDEIDLPLTQIHIADALGLTAVHVNRTLRSLREAGMIQLHAGRLRVLDPRRMAALAGLDAELAQYWTLTR